MSKRHKSLTPIIITLIVFCLFLVILIGYSPKSKNSSITSIMPFISPTSTINKADELIPYKLENTNISFMYPSYLKEIKLEDPKNEILRLYDSETGYLVLTKKYYELKKQGADECYRRKVDKEIVDGKETNYVHVFYIGGGYICTLAKSDIPNLQSYTITLKTKSSIYYLYVLQPNGVIGRNRRNMTIYEPGDQLFSTIITSLTY